MLKFEVHPLACRPGSRCCFVPIELIQIVLLRCLACHLSASYAIQFTLAVIADPTVSEFIITRIFENLHDFIPKIFRCFP